MSSSSASSSSSSSGSPERSPESRKRKREDKSHEEIEVDVSAPEPPSKKALRRAKKGKPVKTVAENDKDDEDDEENPEAKSKRSEYGVWIGNLPWSAGKPELTKFMLDNAEISEPDITRIHMPVPPKGKMDPARQRLQAQNKGFAYVDFKTEKACKAVIALSEKLLAGRRLLIKNAKSYEGRPDAATAAAEKNGEKNTKPPSKRIFIGNLAHEVTQDELKDQFSKCGEVLSVFMATFEDSGNCKGYAWITFKEVEPAEKAVKGYVELEQEESDDEQDEKKPKKAKKPRKWWVNRLHGRNLRIEFAEDPTTRYQKRYGKGKSGSGDAGQEPAIVEVESSDYTAPIRKDRPKGGHGAGTDARPKRKVDARTIAPGAALSKAPRQSAAIIVGQGQKKTFD